jgi:hypothetical protein
MQKNVQCCVTVIIVFLCMSVRAVAINVETKWGGDAGMVYENGFMHMLMKHSTGGVSLFNMELIENDAPGSGLRSEKGVYSDNIWGKYQARKILNIDDPLAEKAWLITQFYHIGKYPLQFKVNGHKSQIEVMKNSFPYRYTEFPAEWLKKGKNVIELSCLEATTKDEGWEIWLSRADEFEDGGGNPEHVGETSFKSLDGGKRWKESPFGPELKDRAEYTVRLSLDRYVQSGWLASPVIDLWKGESNDLIVPLREIQKMKLIIESEVPEGTKVDYYFHRGTSPYPFSDEWEPYKLIGSGPYIEYEIGGADLNRRFVQFKAALSTTNPLITPIVRSANISAELSQRIPNHNNIFIVDYENPIIKYSSLEWEWEPSDRPELKILSDRVNLDEIIAGSRTQLEAVMKMARYVSKVWRNMSPWPGYPSWNALSILDRAEYAGGGGYCLMLNTVLVDMCKACGWQAHLTHIDIHEVCEVWDNDFGKWIFVDADYVNHYNYDVKTGVPLHLQELHNLYLDYYFPGKTLDWMKDTFKWQPIREDLAPPVARGSITSPKGAQLSGFINAAYIYMDPRNNFFEKPIPRCLNQCHVSTWDGFIQWYDERTPPRRQFSLFTDRARDMYPDLNMAHIDALQGFGNDQLLLRFETYTPNFSHFEIDVDNTGWDKINGERWTWLLQSGRNEFRIRAVNKLGAKGKPSYIILNHADRPFAE